MGNRFTVGYGGHARGLVRVRLERITVLPSSHFMFEVLKEGGRTSSVPLHRVREVWVMVGRLGAPARANARAGHARGRLPR